jgi:hypothetical protein
VQAIIYDKQDNWAVTSIFVDKTNKKGDFAGVFEADDDVGYFYLYELGRKAGEKIIGAVQVCRGIPDFAASDVDIRWFDDETKVGVFIKGELGACFDLISGRGFPGTYSRTQS